MQRVKLVAEPDFRNVTRTGKLHPPVADDARGRPRRHDHDAVGEPDRLFEIMSDEQHRLAVGVPQFQQQIAHDLSGLGIERPEWLVHQQDFWITYQHLRQAYALALAARQHVRIAVAERTETDRGQPALRPLQCHRARRALDFEADGHIVDRGFPGKQRVGLKQIAGVPVEADQRLVEDPHRARSGLQQAGGDVEKRRFPAAGRPDDSDELAMRDAQTSLFDRGIDAVIVEAERHGGLVKCDRRWICGDIRLHAFPRYQLLRRWDYRAVPDNSTGRGHRQTLRWLVIS